MSEMTAMVLAGGGGEPLSVLTAERAVSALPFGGKYRVIDFVLSNCTHSGVTRIGVLTQHAPTSLHDHIGAGRPWDLDRRGGSVTILQPYVTRQRSGWYRGTADALVRNWSDTREPHGERTLVLAGDHVYRMDYRELQGFHEERGATLTLPVARVGPSEVHRFGMVTADAGGRVRRMDEKPAESASPFASMGIYLFETAALDQALRAGPVDLVREIVIPMIEGGERVFAYEFESYWEDVGTVETYYRSNLELLAPEPRLRLLDPDWPILTRDEERAPAIFGAHAAVAGSLVAGGCRVDGEIESSILFPGVVVERGATIRGALLFNDVVVRAGARVERCILDKFVEVGANARIGGESASRDPFDGEGLTLMGKDVHVPAGARIGRGVVVGVGAGPGDLGNGDVPDGAVVAGRAAGGGWA